MAQTAFPDFYSSFTAEFLALKEEVALHRAQWNERKTITSLWRHSALLGSRLGAVPSCFMAPPSIMKTQAILQSRLEKRSTRWDSLSPSVIKKFPKHS
jgi:hypothetical protein